MKTPGKKHKEEETVFQQILGLHGIGEYITLLIALVPTIVIILIRTGVSEGDTKPGKLLIELCCIVTLGWLLIIEKFGRVTITTPHIPIPIKWIIPFIMILALFGVF